MRHKALTLAVAALLAFGASGVVAASISPSPLTATAAQSPADTASSTNHTVEVIDPLDRLSEQDVENARKLAWANETVKSYFEDGTPVHFHVQAVGDEDELSVYVAPNSTAEPRVQAGVDLNSKSVVEVKELDHVTMADELKTMKLSPVNASNTDPSETVTVEAASENETFTVDDTSAGEEFSVTVVSDAAESGTFRIDINELET